MTRAEARCLLSFNAWANRRLFQTAAEQAEDVLQRDLAASHGSLWGTLRHIVWGEWLWLGRWTGSQPPNDPMSARSLVELDARRGDIVKAQLDFVSALDDSDLRRIVAYDNPPGTTWKYALADMIRHVVNHSSYHRGQVAALFRQTGITPPATDYLIYFDEGAPDSLT